MQLASPPSSFSLGSSPRGFASRPIQGYAPLSLASGSRHESALPLWAMAIPMGLVFSLYPGIAYDLARQWADDPNFSHGFLVPIFSGYLIWRARDELAAIDVEGSWLGLPVLVGGVAALVLGSVGAELFLMRSSFILVLAGLVLLLLGPRFLRRLSFPLFFLFFMIPPPAVVFNAIAFPLQTLAAENATWALHALGVAVLREGNVIHLSRLTLGVAEACSGIRSLVSLLALAVGWGYLSLSSLGVVLLALSVPPITIVANAARVVVTGLIGQSFGIEYAQGFFHLFSGWLIFLVAFAGMVVVEGILRRFLPPRVRLA